MITTLRKEGAPLIRYRTHDITKIIPGKCPCGSEYPRIDIIIGRTDDMVKVKGVNMYPAQFEETLSKVDGIESEYQVMIDHLYGKDIITLFFETGLPEEEWNDLEKEVQDRFRAMVGVTIDPKAVHIGDLPRNEKKTSRIFDNRY